MEFSISGELYSETLQQLNGKMGSITTADSEQCDLHDSVDGSNDEDCSLWGDSVEEQNGTSDLDREWERRHIQFHTIGYRDGLMAGKAASAQDGFNVGFKESVFSGFKWGLVRGVASALYYLPDSSKERLVKSEGARTKFQQLHESVHSLSTADALKLFHDNLANKSGQRKNNDDLKSQTSDLPGRNNILLENYNEQLESLLTECPAIQVHPEADQ